MIGVFLWLQSEKMIGATFWTSDENVGKVLKTSIKRTDSVERKPAGGGGEQKRQSETEKGN